MYTTLIRAGCFVAIILLGWGLRTLGYFKPEDFTVLSRIVLRITLPAAVIVSFNGRELDPSMLALSLLGLGFGVLYMSAGYLITAGKPAEKRAFSLLNLSGYNIGNFALPFTQSFLGPAGIITTSLFDAGNSIICLGGAHSIASMVQGGGRFSLKALLKSMIRSVPFDTYVIMTALSLLHLSLPQPVISLAEIVRDANAFLAMLMLGIGFRLPSGREQLGTILSHLLLRYGIALLLALGCWFLLPVEREVHVALTILIFSPIASAAPAFTGELNGDVGLSSALNSMSILISIAAIVTVLTITA